MKTIVFTAQAFGFGPVSKMLAISESLSDVHKIFFGSGVAFDLASLHSFDEIHNFEHSDKEKILSLLKRSDLFINVMDFPLGGLAKLAGCTYYLIDTLLWFWPKCPESVEHATLYFCQEFFGRVEPKIHEYGLKNAQLVGPIRSDTFSRLPKRDQVIVNFGGMECPFIQVGSNSQYPFVILKALLPILQSRFANVLVTGRERVIQMCRKKFGEDDRLQFRMLDRKSMLEELYRSPALLTTPGIEIFYDAFDKLPIFCLPPQSDSNWKDLEIFVDHNAIKHSFQWKELYELDFKKNLDEEEMIKIVLAMIKISEYSQKDQNLLREKVERFLAVSDTWPELVLSQKKIVEKFGDNGTKVIVEEIQKLLLPPDFHDAKSCHLQTIRV